MKDSVKNMKDPSADHKKHLRMTRLLFLRIRPTQHRQGGENVCHDARPADNGIVIHGGAAMRAVLHMVSIFLFLNRAIYSLIVSYIAHCAKYNFLK